jgi:hypothetical protein
MSSFCRAVYFITWTASSFRCCSRLRSFPLLRWRSTPLGNVLKGLLFGTILAPISCLFMTPRVYFPDGHVGFFSHNLGWKLILAVYLWHWVYGLHLGVIYNPRGDEEQDA